MISFVYVCVSVCLCVCVCVCVCVKAKCVDISARIATKIHTRTKNFPGKVLKHISPARLIRRGGNSPSSCFNWRKVWTGVKCNFSSAHFQKRYVVWKLSFSQVWMWNFTRIGPQTKKLWLSIIPALKRSHQPRLGQPQKDVNRNFSWSHLDKSYVAGKLSISEP